MKHKREKEWNVEVWQYGKCDIGKQCCTLKLAEYD